MKIHCKACNDIIDQCDVRRLLLKSSQYSLDVYCTECFLELAEGKLPDLGPTEAQLAANQALVPRQREGKRRTSS